jgi:hypothetical protein
MTLNADNIASTLADAIRIAAERVQSNLEASAKQKRRQVVRQKTVSNR